MSMTMEQLKTEIVRAQIRMEAALNELLANTEGIEIGDISYHKKRDFFTPMQDGAPLDVKVSAVVELTIIVKA